MTHRVERVWGERGVAKSYIHDIWLKATYTWYMANALTLNKANWVTRNVALVCVINV